MKIWTTSFYAPDKPADSALQSSMSAPVAVTMDRATLVARFGEMEVNEGAKEWVTMKDGWKLMRETWTPAESPKAVVLMNYGNGESTRSIGIRRLAHASLKRGFVLETYDRAGHGESLEKNGKEVAPRGFRGAIIDREKGVSAWTDHTVEIAEIIMRKHKLPLIVLGHSGAGAVLGMATNKLIALADEHGLPHPIFLYLSPGIGFMQANAPCGMACCHYCLCGGCWVCCCCNCCGKPCIPNDMDYMNPDSVLGPPNHSKYVNCNQGWMETLPPPMGTVDVPDVAACMTELQPGYGVVYYGSKDEVIPRKKMEKLVEVVPALTFDLAEGKPHDYLNMNKINGDTTSVDVIEHLMDTAQAKLPQQVH